jgi:endo-1,4-beta-D-glucanase Y
MMKAPTISAPPTRTAVALAVVIVLITAGVSEAATLPSAGRPTYTSATEAFLQRYVRSNGRVVRIDQGGDTVSEGQAYAMLLAVAIGDRATFNTVWKWSVRNLNEPDGLFASSWNGNIVDSHSASDADLDIARALLLGSKKWNDPALAKASRHYAKAILANETVTVAGQTILVAGPWATTAPYWVDPSYFDPETFDLLLQETGDERWASIESSSEAVLESVTNNGTQLPPNWVQVDASGHASPSGGPAGGTANYGYDAFRVLIRQAEGCPASTTRSLVTKLAPLVQKTASSGDSGQTYNLNGSVATGGSNPLMWVAAAATSTGRAQSRYLARAQRAAKANPTYFLDAWVALGRILITTSTLGGCAQ